MAVPTEIARRSSNALATREEFGVVEQRMNAEFAALSMAARAKAEVEARFVMAERNPRDWDDVRIRLLADCERPEFAKAAWYKIPNRGEGFTIRFAEALTQHMGNIYAPCYTIYEDDERRKLNACVVDLERNVTWEKEVIVTKTVERKDLAGRDLIRVRQKRDGSSIYIVTCTDEELLTKEAMAVSKAQRTNALRLVPPDIKEEARKLIAASIARKVSEDPDAERKAIADAFAEIGVMPSHLKEYIGCELAQVAPAELIDLRQLYAAIKDGQTTWRELMAEKRGEAPETDKGKATGGLKERLKSSTEPTPGPATTNVTPVATTPQAEKKESKKSDKPDHVIALEAYREKIGEQAWLRILGSNGAENADNVKSSNWRPIAAEMEEELRTQNEERAAKAKQ